MRPGRSHTLTKSLATSFCAVTLVMATASTAWAQFTQELFSDLFSEAETLTVNDGSFLSRGVALSGDTAVVFREGAVDVFDREPGGNDWLQTATLAPSDGTSRFGLDAAIDGSTIVVGAAGAAFVFQREPGVQVWQEVARLTGDADAVLFGGSIAISGTTVLLGSGLTIDPTDPDRTFLPGVAYVFEQDADDAHAWGRVARLAGPTPPPGFIDDFGFFVALDRDTAVIAALFDAHRSGAYVFSRNHDGPNTWGRVAALALPESTVGPSFSATAPDVAIDGDTAVLGGHLFNRPRIFERNHGGPNAWGEVQSIDLTNTWEVNLSGDLLLVSAEAWPLRPFGGFIFARNQGGQDAWGEVARIRTPAVEGEIPRAVAISRDTVFVGSVYISCPRCPPPSPIEVYVADTDHDGLRDGADPCPRDPLNDVAAGCQRASGVHPVFDELIAQGEVTSETHGRRQIITATFTNTSDTAVQNPFFEVTELTGHNVLLNGDAGRGRIGATLSPDVGDGVLSPGESMTVTFRIRLRTPNPFQFFVTFHGDPEP